MASFSQRDQRGQAGEFFLRPSEPTHRRYEALRAYLVEGARQPKVADAFVYATDTFHDMVREFRSGRQDFFMQPHRGPKVAPGKEAARWPHRPSCAKPATPSTRSPQPWPPRGER